MLLNYQVSAHSRAKAAREWGPEIGTRKGK